MIETTLISTGCEGFITYEYECRMYKLQTSHTSEKFTASAVVVVLAKILLVMSNS